MAERSDVYVIWDVSPRLIVVEAPSVEITLQDLVDTCRGLLEQPLDNLDKPYLINASGKQVLGVGKLVGITVELQNAQLLFEARTTTTSTGTEDTGGTNNILFDSTADFVTDAIKPGDVVINFTDGSMASVIEVIDLNTLRTTFLTGGTADLYSIGDTYRVYSTIIGRVKDGNVVAVDTNGDPIDPIFTTANVAAQVEADTSAALLSGGAQQADVDAARDAIIVYVGQKIP